MASVGGSCVNVGSCDIFNGIAENYGIYKSCTLNSRISSTDRDWDINFPSDNEEPKENGCDMVECKEIASLSPKMSQRTSNRDELESNAPCSRLVISDLSKPSNKTSASQDLNSENNQNNADISPSIFVGSCYSTLLVHELLQQKQTSRDHYAPDDGLNPTSMQIRFPTPDLIPMEVNTGTSNQTLASSSSSLETELQAQSSTASMNDLTKQLSWLSCSSFPSGLNRIGSANHLKGTTNLSLIDLDIENREISYKKFREQMMLRKSTQSLPDVKGRDGSNLSLADRKGTKTEDTSKFDCMVDSRSNANMNGCDAGNIEKQTSEILGGNVTGAECIASDFGNASSKKPQENQMDDAPETKKKRPVCKVKGSSQWEVRSKKGKCSKNIKRKTDAEWEEMIMRAMFLEQENRVLRGELLSLRFNSKRLESKVRKLKEPQSN